MNATFMTKVEHSKSFIDKRNLIDIEGFDNFLMTMIGLG